jgi:hypothetical protein
VVVHADIRCSRLRQVLYVSTVLNARDCRLAVDGSGIALVADRVSAGVLRGSWRPAGIVGGDSGTWRAVRIGAGAQ